MAGKTVMQELLCRDYYVEAAKQELLCRDYDVEAAMERAFPGMGDVFYHGRKEGVSGYGRRLLPWQFLRADIHDDSVLREEGER